MALRAAGGRGASVLAALVVAHLPGPGAAAEVRYEVRLLSHYVWRGITLTDDPVLQPSVTIGHENGLSFAVWGNADLGDDNDTPWELNETRLAVDYARRLGRLELAAGAVEYLFPNTPFPGTREVYLRAGVEAALSPRLELHYDVDELEGGYLRLALAWRRELRPGWRLALEAAAALADDAFSIGPEAGPHDAGVELRLVRTGDTLSVELLAGWTGSLDEEVLPDQPASFWSGVSIARRF